MSEDNSLSSGGRYNLFDAREVYFAQNGMDAVKERCLQRLFVGSPVKPAPDRRSVPCDEKVSHRYGTSQQRRQHFKYIQA